MKNRRMTQRIRGGAYRFLPRASALAMSLAATLAGSSVSARAELLVEEKNQDAGLTSADSAIEAAAVVQPTRVAQIAVPAQAYPVQPVVQPVVIAAAPAAAPAASAAEAADPTERMTRTDLVRRERMRAELRNEDILQERLEELRLQDENRRTGQVLGNAPASAAPSAPLMAGMAVAAPAAGTVTEQVVSVPVTERPGQAVSVSSEASVASVTESESEEVTTLRLTPRAGLSDFRGQSPYQLQGRYSVGAGIDVGVSDHLTFELGYSFSEYGVALNSATAMGLAPVLGMGGYGFNYNQGANTGILRQNVVDAGLKVHLLGRRSKLRPFIGGGAGYGRSFLNYDPRIVTFMRSVGYGMSRDYELSQFLANASAGMELQLSKSVLVGLTYRYYTVLAARQNQALYNPALYGAYPGSIYGGYGYYGGLASLSELDKQYVGGSIADTSFYSVMATVSFSF